MSDLNIYELEDIVWEFGDDDDHIVPHSEGKNNILSVETDCNKRPRLNSRCTESNTLSKGKMLDKRPWTHLSSGGFSPSLDDDSSRKNSCTTSDDERTFDQCVKNSNIDPLGNGLCEVDPILGGQTASVNNSLYQYQLNNATPTESDLDFFGLDDKEGDDLLYFGLNDIENFEDIDRMFRNCDSTFGLNISNDELGWFSSPHPTEGPNNVTKSILNFSECSQSGLESETTQQEVNELNTNGLVADVSDKKLDPDNSKRISQKLTSNGSYVNEPRVGSSIETKTQIPSFPSDPQLQTSPVGKRKEPTPENGSSFIQFNNLKHVDESKHPPSKLQSSFSSENEHHEPSHRTCVQMLAPSINTNDNHSSNHVPPSMTSPIIKSEDSGIPSISPRESSHASNSIQKLGVFRNKKKNRQNQRRMSGNPEKGNLKVQRRDCDPICPQKYSDSENEVEGQSEVDGDAGIVTELDSSNVQESSSMSSVLDEVSIDASSFQQLQDVMEKLDIRTKLCIRDSLYRLARSAEQRHKCLNPTSGDNDDRDASGALLAYGANKCTGFMDMETDTNPIDRSIAHLLFHRPSNPSVSAPFDTLPVKFHPTGPVVAEKPGTQKDTISADGEVAQH